MKKQILFVIESLNCGGAEKSLITLLNNLDYSRVEVSLLIFNKGGAFEKLLTKEVKIIYHKCLDPVNNKKCILGRIKFWLLRKAYHNESMHNSQLWWKSMEKYISKLEGYYPITIAYNQGFSTYFVSHFVQSDKKYAWINTDYEKAGYNPTFDYEFYKSFDKIVAVSPESRNSFIHSMKSIGIKMDADIIKDIVDENIIWSLSKELPFHSFDCTYINLVTVARLTSLKGLKLIPPTCRILLDKGYKIHWYIVGEGNERKNIEKHIKELKLDKYITLVGFTSNPYSYIRACDIYVQTSTFEGLGLSLIEASLLHKPIITTNFDTAFSIIKHGETGLICEMNSDDIAQHVEMFLNDKELEHRVMKNLQNSEGDDKRVSLNLFYSLIGI